MNEIAIIVLINLVAYFRVLRCEYIIDDQYVPKGRGRNFIDTFFLQLHGLKYSSKEFEHMQRVLIHAGNAVLIYFAFGQNPASFWAALLWSVNPANNQGVCWLNGVGYGMSAMCVLGMYMTTLSWGALLYFYSMFWHVTAVFAPVLYLARGPWYGIAIAILFPIIGWLVDWNIPFFKHQSNATLRARLKVPTSTMKSIYARKLVFILKTWTYYFYFSLIPARVGMYHSFGYSFGLGKEETAKWQRFSPLFWLGVATFIGHIILIVEFWGTPLATGLLWYTLFISQWCNVMTMQQTIAERYVYIPSIGLMVALTWLLFSRFTTHFVPVMTAIMSFYVTKLLYFIPSYQNMRAYVEHNLIDFPDQFAAWNWKGILHLEKGQKFSAISAFANGLKFRPFDFRLNLNLGSSLKEIGFLHDAINYYKDAGKGLLDEEGHYENKKALEGAIKECERLIAHFEGKTKGGIILPGRR